MHAAVTGPASMSADQLKRYCKSSKHQDQCDLYSKYAPQKEALWRYYRTGSIRKTPLFDKTPEELFDIYEETVQDIAFLWEKDPEYINEQNAEIAKLIAIGVACLLAAEALSALVATGALASDGLYTYAVANGLRISSAFIPVGSSFQLSLLSAAASSATVAATAVDLSVAFLALSALTVTDMQLLTFAQQSLARAGEDQQIRLDEIESVVSPESAAEKMRVKEHFQNNQQMFGLLRDKLGTQTSIEEHTNYVSPRESTARVVFFPEGPGYLNSTLEDQLIHDTHKTMVALRKVIREQYAQEGWGKDPDEAFKKHVAVLRAVYALEYVRAEMSDLSDGFRYRKAARDIATIYQSYEFKLADRNALEEHVVKRYEQQRAVKLAEQEMIGQALTTVILNKY